MKLNYKEYTQIHQRKSGYDSDTISRYIIQEMLKGYGVSNIIETQGNNSTDLIGILPNGIKAAFEIKDRECPSTKYNDHMIESIKLQSLIKRKQKNEFQQIFLISIFEDSTIYITKDIDTINYTKTNKPCPTTTKLNNHKLIYKEVCIYKPTDIRYLEINIKDKIEYLHFSDTPFNNIQSNKPLF